MPKRISKPPIRTELVRHSFKKSGTKTGLSAKGIAAARKSGRTIPLHYKVAGRHSGSSRAKSTLELAMASFREKGGKTYKTTRPRKKIGLKSVFKNDEAIKIVDKWIEQQGEVNVLRKWIDGKISTRLVFPANQVADNIIKWELGFGSYLAREGVRGINVRYQSHSWIVDAVFERLTGKKFNLIAPGTVSRENERIVLTHYKNGKTILSYRGKSFDVTKRFSEIAK